MIHQVNTAMLSELTVIAALLHDVGKSNNAFQRRLRYRQKGGDYYRHEWLSLKIFVAMIDGCKTDADWLVRFSQLECTNMCSSDTISLALEIDAPHFEKSDIDTLPPLAQLVAWLIVTHHRLPPSAGTQLDNRKAQKEKLIRAYDINVSSGHAGIDSLYQLMHAFDGWQKNPVVMEKEPNRAKKAVIIKRLVIDSAPWRGMLAKFSEKALNNPMLFDDVKTPKITAPIDCNYTLYLSRLLLILSDHNYSSLSDGDFRRIDISTKFNDMFANSNASDGTLRQSLDEHLIGVGSFTHRLAKKLPSALSRLPRILDHKPLAENTPIKRFAWQNQAYAAASAIRKHSEKHGFFGVNLASSGAGKTIGNARIMYALADPDLGARITVALGLRVLTLQTGQQFRSKLDLNDSEAAVVVGGDSNIDLREMNSQSPSIGSEVSDDVNGEVIGSESSESIYPHNVDASDNYLSDFDVVMSNDTARKMLLSPILSCTIDHLIQASESLRGGTHIPPALRLMSSDLILDEPDDFGVDDMYALSRLVFTAGLLGSRVLLSSATLTPSMVTFLFDAYISGRERYNRANGLPTGDELKVATLFVDEQTYAAPSPTSKGYYPYSFLSNNHDELSTHYTAFIENRVSYLDSIAVRHSASIVDVGTDYDADFPEMFYESVAQTIVDTSVGLHDRHHDDNGETKVSVGLVRMAYTKSIVAIAEQIASTSHIPSDTHIHFCCYHSRQILALRSSLESRLDAILDRSDPEKTLLDSQYITDAIKHSDATNHIFIVLATPISEVGRDHDYDWAIIEPSSIRSIIKIAGRVWAHRPSKPCDSPNIAILRYNLRYFTRGTHVYSNQNVFIHSGFEADDNKITGYDVSQLIDRSMLDKIDSKARIANPSTTMIADSLVELEHNMLRKILNPHQCCITNAIWHKQTTMYAACTDMQVITPFRENIDKNIGYVVAPEGDELNFYCLNDLVSDEFNNISTQNHIIKHIDFDSENQGVSLWLKLDMNNELELLSNKKTQLSTNDIVKTYFTVSLHDTRFFYNEFLGFYYRY